MTKLLVQDMVTCLNMLLSKNGISNNLIPASIILGYPNTDYNKLIIPFGAYAQVYLVTSDITKQRTVGEISIRSENEQGGYYFMSIDTDRKIHSYIWTELPINEQATQRVYDLTTK